ncbi:MAG: diguanylate cyclase [Deltaproteobacteria bacterium]|nr:diguanylate cyclase [Deltaproteobacteria bacterium]
MKPISSSLGFKLVIASMVLALVTIGLGGVLVYKISEDAIKVDAQGTARQLAREVSGFGPSLRPGSQQLVDALTSLKVEKFGSAWVMDRNGFLIAHMDPKFRNLVEAQTYIGDTYVDLNVGEQPIQQIGEKNIVHKAKLQELIEKFDGGFGTYNFLGDTRIIAFRVIKDRGWLVAVDQPISTAYSELTRIKKIIFTTCIVISVLVFAFTWFAIRIIIKPYYHEQEETNQRLEMMNRELEASRRKLEKSSNSLNRLYDLSIAMQYTGFLETHLPLVLGVAQERFDVDRILLMMPDDDGKLLRCRASVGNVFESEEKIFVPIGAGGGALARSFLAKRTIFHDGTTPVPEEWRVAEPYDRIRSLRARAFAVFPMITKEKVIGVLGVDNKMSRRALSREDIEAVENFAHKVASLIENTLQLQAMRKAAHEMDIRDRLTTLFRLRHARGLAEESIAAAVRDKVPFAMGVVYLANFKEYNELNGYQRGDFVLQKTAEMLRKLEVMGAVPARCYGATFLALFPGKTEDQAKYLLSQFANDFEQFTFYGEKRLREGKLVTRVNVAEYRRDSGQTFDEFFSGLELA